MSKILIVDDNASNLRSYEGMLKSIKGTQITAMPSSSTALAWALENEPDLIVLDYIMPGLNGLEFVQAFRRNPAVSDIPIIFVTKADQEKARYSALQLGVDDFLKEPVDPLELLPRAKNLLKLHERTKRLSEKGRELENSVHKATDEVHRRERESIHRLTRATEHRDTDTRHHITRIGHYAKLTAEALGLSADTQELYLLAAPMHDVGKVAIPDRIMLKRGKLAPDEWEIMKGHARAGYDILKESESPLIRLGAEIAFTHHERFNGMGYPRRLKGKDIPLSGRIVAIADVFDALISNRPYKPAWKIPDAIAAVRRESGGHFDPEVVTALLDIMPRIMEVWKTYNDAAV